jgi:iron complex transport system permease protein
MVKIPIFAISVFILGTGTILIGKRLKAIELGDEAATALGVHVTKTRLLLTLFAVALSAVATAVAGPIAFVSFLSGPIAARMTGEGRATAIPAALTGAALVLSADLVGQFMFETRFPVGIITGILGAPYLIFLLIKANKKGGAI